MTIYVLLILYVLVISKARISDRLKMILIFGPIMFISAFRDHSVGNDLKHYVNIFETIIDRDWDNLLYTKHIEIGFAVYCKLLGYISRNTQFFIAYSSILICYYIAKTIIKYSYDVGLSAFLFVTQYYLFFSFSAVRQYMALSLIFYAFNLYIHGDIKKSIPYFLVAFSFHYTSLAFIPVLFLVKFKINKRNIFLIVSSMVVIGLSYKYIFYDIINSFERFSYYQSYDLSRSGRGWDINIILYVIHAIIIAFSISQLNKYMRIYKRDNKIEKQRFSNLSNVIREIKDYNEIYSYMVCITISLGLNLASVVMGSAARMCQYFFIYMILSIPLLLCYLDRNNRMLVRISIYFMFFVYCVLMLSHNNYYVVPYSLCF